jgi:hypothetical protein
MADLRLARRWGIGAGLVLAIGCADADRALPDADSSTARVDSSAGVILVAGAPYSPVDMRQFGGIDGTVLPADSGAMRPDSAGFERTGPCAASTKNGDEGEADVTPTVIWVDDARAGKKLPRERRYELTSVGCELEPRVMAVLTGGAINVFNDDRTAHRLVFLRSGTNDTVQVMPFATGGQLVATDRLTAKPGMIEVRCAQHPWTRAHIAVFDHPYFVVVDRGESFAIDSLPPGSYTVRSWFEGAAKPSEQPAVLSMGTRTSIAIR